tara:strand:- start:1069 stop:2193 length:1125 start_codon:yes stop_codon:yes gene_type:complete
MSGDEPPLFVSWLVALIATPVGLVFAIIIFGHTADQLSTTNWDTTIGTIEEYDLSCNYDSEGGCVWEEYIEYSYTVDNRYYTNNQVSLGWTEMLVEYNTEALGIDDMEHYEGNEVVVFYHPVWPEESVLLAGWDGMDLFDIFIFVIAIIIPLISLIRATRGGKLSEAINELQELLGMITQNDGMMPQNHQHRWNGEQWTPIQGQNVQVSSNAGKGGISPSRTRGYNSVIAKLSLGGGQMTEEMVKSKLQTELDLSQKDAQKFVESPYVRSVIFPNNLSLEETNASNFDSDLGEQSLTNAFENQLISNFQAAMQDAMEEQGESNSPTTTLDSNVETCSHEGCNNVMTFYSFQCFSCRKKFCDEHKGASIHCADCA